MRETSPLYKALREAGVRASYASMIASGHRVPSMKLALEVYDKTGVKIGPLANRRKRDIAILARAHEMRNGATA